MKDLLFFYSLAASCSNQEFEIQKKKKIKKTQPVKKGCNIYFFSKEGIQEEADENTIYTCRAINEKNAKKKYEKFLTIKK